MNRRTLFQALMGSAAASTVGASPLVTDMSALSAHVHSLRPDAGGEILECECGAMVLRTAMSEAGDPWIYRKKAAAYDRERLAQCRRN